MASLGKLNLNQHPIHLSLTQSSPSFLKTPSSLSFRSFKRASSIRASSSSKHQSIQSLPSRLLKSTCITFTAASALLLANLHLKSPPAIASPLTPPSVESIKHQNDNVSLEEESSSLENHLSSHPDDVTALRSLMEVKIKSRNLLEAIDLLNRLIALEPDEKEWPILKANIFSHNGDLESAKKAFEEIISKEPLRVEAYHGLAMAYSESGDDLNVIEERIQEAMVRCKKERKNGKDLRDFKLLVAQIRVLEGKHEEALKVYQELVKEEPRDFRPYLCQGIIYTLLKKGGEAEKQFEKFRRLVPRNHPYREYFMDNMVATKLFAEKAQREMAGTKG
ncbi:unnamed protein product [Eruca vesicaria subsp. sativa]|uniref:Chloroplast lumen common family protein n=1 Tax=Eruca vesicaria subsp. sativa TaxID=29727 RepID=A0ABC8LTN7_ERUVS|nr:unnamed protein product [Eruca vesicaria subsp. sativa]